MAAFFWKILNIKKNLLHFLYRVHFNIPAPALGFELHFWSQFRRILITINLWIKRLDALHTGADKFFEKLVIVRFSLKNKIFAGRQVNHVKTFRNDAAVIRGNFNSMGIAACAGKPHILRQLQPRRLINRFLDLTKHIPGGGTIVLTTPNFFHIAKVILSVFTPFQDQFSGRTFDDLRKNDFSAIISTCSGGNSVPDVMILISCSQRS